MKTGTAEFIDAPGLRAHRVTLSIQRRGALPFAKPIRGESCPAFPVLAIGRHGNAVAFTLFSLS